jgi:exopolysaccharide biosynthesis polyprenyl glycosylphosphotransferase
MQPSGTDESVTTTTTSRPEHARHSSPAARRERRGTVPPAAQPRRRLTTLSSTRRATSHGSPARRHFRKRATATLIVSDYVALASSTIIAVVCGWTTGVSGPALAAAVLAVFAIGTLANICYGLYTVDAARSDHTTIDDLWHVFHMALLVTCGSSLVIYVNEKWLPVKPALVLFAAIVCLTLLLRGSVRTMRARYPGFEQRTVIVGAGAVGQLIGTKLTNRPIHGFELIGFVDDDVAPVLAGHSLAEVPWLGRVREIPDIVKRHDIDRVIVAFTRQSHMQTMELVDALKQLEIHVDVVPRLFDVFGAEPTVHTIDGLPLVGHRMRNSSRTSRTIKRAVDVSVATMALAVLAPMFALIAILLKCGSRGPVFYSGERLGQGGRPFRQLKFRTMYVDLCDGPDYGGSSAQAAFEKMLSDDPTLRHAYITAHKLPDDPRVTRLGRLLRRTSLDELPQLFNVLRGDLSLVGPRPVTRAELSRYGQDGEQLLSVRPGLTGLWQVTGRSALAYEERVRLDLAYVKDWSLKLDTKIMLRSPSLFTSRTRAV